MSERPIEPVPKTGGVLAASVGSNPTPSANLAPDSDTRGALWRWVANPDGRPPAEQSRLPSARHQALSGDNVACIYCGSVGDLTLDHVIPKWARRYVVPVIVEAFAASRDGYHHHLYERTRRCGDMLRLKAACKACNSLKGAMPPAKFKRSLFASIHAVHQARRHWEGVPHRMAKMERHWRKSPQASRLRGQIITAMMEPFDMEPPKW